MADATSPSTDAASFSEATAPADSPVIAFVKQYWYAFVAVGLIAAFLIYSRLHNSAAVGPAQAASAGQTTDANGNVVGSTQDQSAFDNSNIVGMMSTQNQAILDAIAKEAAAEKPPAPKPGVKPKPKPKGKPKPPVHHTAAWNKAHAKELAKLHPPPKAAPHPANLSGAHGGPPPFGPSVPFGTYGYSHDPLTHSGTMFASERR